MKTPAPAFSPLHDELYREVARIRRLCRTDGTTALGFDCLFSQIRFQNIPSAPHGTNCAYYLKQALREVVSGREFASFILS